MASKLSINHYVGVTIGILLTLTVLTTEPLAYTDLMHTVTPEIRKFCSGSGEDVAGVTGDLNGDGIIDYLLLTTGHSYRSPDIWINATISSNSKVGYTKLKSFKLGPVGLDTVLVENGVLYIKGKIHQDGDPNCCPSKNMNFSFKLQNGTFVKVK